MQVSFKNCRTLHDLKPAETAILAAIDLPEDFAQRIMQMGFVPGMEVTLGASAPGGDPRVYQVDGAEIALRADTARRLRLR